MSEEKKKYKIEGRPQTIYRVVKSADNPYVMIDRRPIDNAKLSFKAKGLLTYLMSRPDGWEVSVADLVNHTTEGEASVRSGLKQLKDAGHLKYTASRKQGRITGWLIEVFEVSKMAVFEQKNKISPDSDFQDVENLNVEKLDVENRTQVLSTLSNKEKSNTTDANFSSICKVYTENIGLITELSAEMLKEIADTYPAGWFEDAVKESVKNNVRKLNYVKKILESWQTNGRSSKKDKALPPREEGKGFYA